MCNYMIKKMTTFERKKFMCCKIKKIYFREHKKIMINFGGRDEYKIPKLGWKMMMSDYE